MTDVKNPQSRRGLLGLILAVTAMFSLSFFWHNYAISSAVSEFTAQQISTFQSHVLFILLLQSAAFLAFCAGLKALKITKKTSDLLAAIVLGALLTINAFSLIIMHMEPFAQQAKLTKVLLAAIALFIGYSLSAAMLKTRFLAGILTIIGVVLAFLFMPNPVQDKVNNDVKIQMGSAPKDARNIYFISFDSMIPRSLAKEFLGLDTVPYMDTLDKYGARVFKNSFTAYRPTQPSLNSMLTLDLKGFSEMDRKQRLLFFSGEKQSNVSRFLHKNGYRAQTLYDSAYFGTQKGPYIDYYNTGERVNSACDHVNPGVVLGYCNPAISALSQPLTKRKAVRGMAADESDDRIAQLIKRFGETAASDQPWFSMTHIYMPGHTPKEFRFDNPDDLAEYKEFFASRSIIAAEYIDRILAFLEKNDPDALALFSGDHGTYITRALRPTSISDEEARRGAQKRFVKDRNGINIAVWPGEACNREFAELYDISFTINLDVGRKLIECATSQPMLPDVPLTAPDNRRFQPYIYE